MAGLSSRSAVARLCVGVAALGLLAYGTVWSLGTRTEPVPAASSPTEPAAVSTERAAVPPEPEREPCYVGVLASRGEIDLHAEHAGVLVRVLVDVGDPVVAGQELARVESPDGVHRLQEQSARVDAAAAAVDGARVAARRAQKEMERRRNTPEIFSTEQIEAAQFELEMAELEKRRLEAALTEARATRARLEQEQERGKIRAPFPGRVSARYALPGTAVTTGLPLLRLVAGTRPSIRFAVPAADVDHFPVGAQIHAEVHGNPDLRASARVETVAPVLDEATGLIFLEAAADHPTWTQVPVGAVLRVAHTERTDCPQSPTALLPRS